MLVSQSTSPQVHALYRDRLGCAVIGIPNTGLDPARLLPRRPMTGASDRLGYRAEDVPLYIGHDERRQLAEFFAANADKYRAGASISRSIRRGRLRRDRLGGLSQSLPGSARQ